MFLRKHAHAELYRSMAGANIMEVTYGIRVLPEHDPFIELAEAGQEAVSKCAVGFYLVELLPMRAWNLMDRCDDTL